jgi:hypothetical protein
MSRCRDCNTCMFDKQVKFYNKYCVFLCDKCFKKRELESEKRKNDKQKV